MWFQGQASLSLLQSHEAEEVSLQAVLHQLRSYRLHHRFLLVSWKVRATPATHGCNAVASGSSCRTHQLAHQQSLENRQPRHGNGQLVYKPASCPVLSFNRLALRWHSSVKTHEHMLQQAVVNAHILFRLKHASPSSRTLFVFVAELLEAIPVYQRRDEARADANVAFQAAVNQSRWWWSQQRVRRTSGTHTPDMVSRPRDEHGQRPETRKRCKYCMHRLSHIYCTSCDVFLCGGDCWRLFHSEDALPNQDELHARANSSPPRA